MTLDSKVSAVCTERVDAGNTGTSSRFHIYFNDSNKTFCGIDLPLALNMIDQGEQGILRDARVSCRRCNRALEKLRRSMTLQKEGN